MDGRLGEDGGILTGIMDGSILAGLICMSSSFPPALIFLKVNWSLSFLSDNPPDNTDGRRSPTAVTPSAIELASTAWYSSKLGLRVETCAWCPSPKGKVFGEDFASFCDWIDNVDATQSTRVVTFERWGSRLSFLTLIFISTKCGWNIFPRPSAITNEHQYDSKRNSRFQLWQDYFPDRVDDVHSKVDNGERYLDQM